MAPWTPKVWKCTVWPHDCVVAFQMTVLVLSLAQARIVQKSPIFSKVWTTRIGASEECIIGATEDYTIDAANYCY